MARRKSDLSRAFSEDGALKTHVGGQALLEGVMMRGKFNWAVAVREPGGGIYTEGHDLGSGKRRRGWIRAPIARGCRALVESLVIGFKALEIAAAHAFPEDEEDEADECPSEKKPGAPPQGGAARADADCAAREAAGGAARTDADCAARTDADCAARTDAEGASRGSVLDGSTSDGVADEEVVRAEDFVASDGERPFSWADDFGRPGIVIDGLGAQRTLEVAEEPPAAADSVSGKAAVNDASDEAVVDAPERDCAPKAAGSVSDEAGTGAPEKDCASGEAESGGEGSEGGLGKGAMAVSMALGIVLGVALFIVAPAAITNLVVGEYGERTLLWNVVDGILRVAVFVGYIWLIGRMSDIKRMFGYHGAEHKAIHCYEHGLPLTPENARSFPRLHVRCGTAFLIMVMIIAIFVYTIMPISLLVEALGVPEGLPTLAVVVVARIALMPVIAGVSYEITVKWAGSHPENPFVKVVLWPGMQMQYLTTNDPDDEMVECAIAAMKIVLDREEAEAKKVERRARMRDRAAGREKVRIGAEPDAA